MAVEAQGVALDTSTPLNGAAIDFAELAARLTRTERTDEALLAARMFSPENRPPFCEVVYSLAGVPICTAGNLSAVTAAAKAGKSAVIGAMMAATFPNGNRDTLGFRSGNPEGKALCSISTLNRRRKTIGCFVTAPYAVLASPRHRPGFCPIA